MPLVKDLKPQLGDMVVAYMDSLDRLSLTPEPYFWARPGTVITADHDGSNDVFLGWREAEQPNGMVKRDYSPQADHISRTILQNADQFPYWQLYIAARTYVHSIIRIGSGVSTPKEAPCRQCGRNNDIGVPSCWWCTASKPC